MLNIFWNCVRRLRRPFNLQLLLELSHHLLLRLQCSRATIDGLLHLLHLDHRLILTFDFLPCTINQAQLSTPKSHPFRPALRLLPSALDLSLNSSVDGLHNLHWAQLSWLRGWHLGVRALAHWWLSLALLDHLLQVRH